MGKRRDWADHVPLRMPVRLCNWLPATIETQVTYEFALGSQLVSMDLLLPLKWTTGQSGLSSSLGGSMRVTLSFSVMSRIASWVSIGPRSWLSGISSDSKLKA